MHKPNKFTLKTLTFMGISAICLSTVVSCGKTTQGTTLNSKIVDSDCSFKPLSGNKLWKFNNKKFKTKEEAQKAKENYIKSDSSKLHIDSLVINANETGIFDNLKLPEISISGANGSATLEKPKGLNVDEIILEKKSLNSNKFTCQTGGLTGISNGDLINIIFLKRKSSITRTIEVKGLKRNVIDFLKSNKKSDRQAISEIKSKLKSIGINIHKDFLPKIDSFMKEIKNYMMSDLKSKNKSDLVDSIHKLHEFINKRIFNAFFKNGDSFVNELIKKLNKNNIYIEEISNDGNTLKPELNKLMESGLDVLRLFVNNTLNFIENSIEWKPKWKNNNNLINLNTKNLEDKKFINSIMNNKLIEKAGNKDDNIDVAFKTIQELLQGNYEIYKEKINGKDIYHVVKNINSRKIVNTFRKNMKYLETNSKGKVNKLHVIPGQLVDKKLRNALSNARARKESKYRDIDNKKHTSQLNIDSILKMIKNPQIKNAMPVIKDFINKKTFEELLNLANKISPIIFGLSGILNIPDSFNSIKKSVSDSIIDTEINIQGLLTYIFGDEGQVIMDFESVNKNFVLINYKSPQISILDKKNRKSILYNNNLEELFNRFKPIINIVISLLGNI